MPPRGARARAPARSPPAPRADAIVCVVTSQLTKKAVKLYLQAPPLTLSSA